jgi:UDP-glucose 4-epimerase
LGVDREADLLAERVFITGGAGFLGSHFVDRLLEDPAVRQVTVFDNFSSGREWHIAHHLADSRFAVVRGDLRDPNALQKAVQGHALVIHLASNPDIARAASDPSVDFDGGTLLTHRVLEAMRTDTDARRILYTSGSGVYGDLGEEEAHEDHGPLLPISTYGASKLAGEALICSYCHLFGFSARVLRLANVVGPRQTHGVGLDFVRLLAQDPRRLRILGDGRQSKSYIYVSDVVEAALLANANEERPYEVYNVATGDYVSVKEIADLAVECHRLASEKVSYEFSGGSRGWEGDIPVVRMSTARIRSIGWSNSMSSADAVRVSMRALLGEVRAGRH